MPNSNGAGFRPVFSFLPTKYKINCYIYSRVIKLQNKKDLS